MLMSQAASSVSVIGMPSAGDLTAEVCGTPAQAVAASKPSAATRLSKDMFDAPVCAHRPRDDRVVVIGVAGRILREPFAPRRLHLPLFVGRAAQKHGLGAFPFPRETKAHEAFRP